MRRRTECIWTAYQLSSSSPQDPERVSTYARQDVEEVRALAALVTPTEFYQTQLVPENYQSVAVTGTGEKLNSLLVREYLRESEALPRQSAPQEYPGGYTEVRRTGSSDRLSRRTSNRCIRRSC